MTLGAPFPQTLVLAPPDVENGDLLVTSGGHHSRPV